MERSPISILQEFVMQAKYPMPDYKFEINDDNAYPFKCTVQVGDIKASGYGSSKKEAKTQSAKKALEIKGLTFLESKDTQLLAEHTNRSPEVFINYIGKLNELASTRGLPYPEYRDKSPFISAISFSTECSFLKFKTEGCGNNKKQAKQHAAMLMLEQLKDEDISSIKESANLAQSEFKNSARLNQQILEKYEEQLLVETNTALQNEDCPEILVDSTGEYESLEDVLEKLGRMGFKCDLQILMVTPYVVILRIGKSTIIGCGATKQKAIDDLFNMITEMLRHGFSFNPNWPGK